MGTPGRSSSGSLWTLFQQQSPVFVVLYRDYGQREELLALVDVLRPDAEPSPP
jgi:hypothetical protein